MAKKFAGFTPAQLDRIFPELQGLRPQDKQTVLDSDRSMQDRLREMEMEAERRIASREFAEGGYNVPDAPSGTPTGEDEAVYPGALESQQRRSDALMDQVFEDPGALVKDSEVKSIDTTEQQVIDPATGQLKGPAPEVTATTAEDAAEVKAPEKPADGLYDYDPAKVTGETKEVLDALIAATGKPSEEALAEAATMSPQELAQLNLSPAQIAAAQQVVAPDARKLEEGELIDGSTVDMDRVKKETNFEAATGSPSTDATVQGQLTGLMEQFEGTSPPAWAAGAMRAAAAQMAARGLSASSMAGQAAIQAAMESALPIAQADAQTVASFEAQNLSNRQQAAMFAAEKRAQFLNLEFSQEFQTRVQNAAKISDIANMNFSAEQQVALENARLAQSVDLANLDARNAKVLADAAAMSQLDMTNLNNRQQAQVQNAQAFLQMDMANLDNLQQTAMFQAQARINALLSDQAAENAAAQFNSSSQQQTDQFFANLTNQANMFSVEQQNRMRQFNAGELNAMERFNAEMQNQRDMFNTQNSLVIEQANTAWYQKVATADTAAINEANMESARQVNNLTNRAFNELMQETRDLMSFVWDTANKDADRATNLLMQEMETEAGREAARAQATNGLFSIIGSVLGRMVGVGG